LPHALSFLRLALVAAGILLVVWRRRQRAARPGRAFHALLAAAALAGALAYHAQPRLGYLGLWDIYHHHLGAKYAPELGYDKLYGATLAADDEGPRLFANIERVRDLPTQRIVGADALRAQRAFFTAGFTPERWAAFKRDLGWFQRHVDRGLWPLILTDRGYHPTPTWERIARVWTAWIDLDRPGALFALTLPDELFLLAACLALLRAYGPVTAGLFLVALGAIPLHLTPLKGAFLRVDWLAALLASAAAYRAKRHGLAGALLAYATLTRVFPLVFAGGVLARAAFTRFETRRLDRRDARFFGAFAAAAAALFALGLPLSRWRDFAAVIGRHATVLSVQRSGLEYLVGLDRPLLYWPSALLLLAGFAFAARRMPRPRLLPAGVALFFTLVSAASYYHVVAALLALCFHRRGSAADTWGYAALLSAFAVFEIAALAMGGAVGAVQSFLWSLLLLALSIGVVFSADR
jgi:hypothetical protein